MNIPDEDITIHDAHVNGFKRATLSTGLGIFMLTEYPHPQDQRCDRMWYLPLHPACRAVAKKVMAAPGSKITSLGDLWMTLERRCWKGLQQGNLYGFCIPAIPNNRPGERIELGLGRYYISQQAMDPTVIFHVNYGRGWVSLGQI